MYTWVAFDVDGTMIDTEHMVISTLKTLIEEETGGVYSDNELAFAIGRQGELTLQHFGVQDIPRGLARWYDYMDNARHHNKSFQGIVETLEKLRESGFRLAVVTSRRDFELTGDPIFNEIKGYFDEIICADDVSRLKPHPDPLLELMRRQKLKAGEILFIGDTVHDSGAAAAAEVDFALAEWGALNPDSIEADYRLFHPYEVMSVLFLEHHQNAGIFRGRPGGLCQKCI